MKYPPELAHARFGHFSAALVDEQSDRRFVQELQENLIFIGLINWNKT